MTNNIEWESVACFGFDLDGTLYDEFDFIVQTYRAIVTQWGLEAAPYLSFMLNRWLEKGSSYPRIFDEVLDMAGFTGDQKEAMIGQALLIFRTFKPDLALSPRVEFMLADLKSRYPMFLFTDGNPELQSSKINALKLNRFFPETAMFISGRYGKHYSKPEISILPEMHEILSGYSGAQVLYIGDRSRDREFAENAGFQFCYIHQLFHIIA